MNFDRIAPFYRWMEAITAGGKLQRARTTYLAAIPIPQRILLIGEGHGRFLPACVKQFPAAEITVVDISKRMLEIARGKNRSVRVTWIHADLLEWQNPQATYDLIVTHFFLDCFTHEELPAVIAKLAEAATAEANWLIADFQIADAGLAKWRSRIIVSLLYLFFHLVSGLRANKLVPPEPWLEAAGFQRKSRSLFEWGLLKSEWWERKNKLGRWQSMVS